MKVTGAMMITLLKCLTLTSALFLSEVSTVVASEDQELGEVEKFVENIGNEIIDILVHRHQPMEVRKRKFRVLLERDFDMPAISKFVLARYWRVLSPDQIKEYERLFVSAVIENYAAQFDNYNNEKLTVKSGQPANDGGFRVHSLITRPGKGHPLKVEWKIFNTSSGMKVLDIVVDGVSMSITLRSEYSGVYNDRGGIDGLLEYLRERVNESAASKETSKETSRE